MRGATNRLDSAVSVAAGRPAPAKGPVRYVIETEDLTKFFPIQRTLRGTRPAAAAAVDNVSLRLAEGEILGLVGPNGAGKTTLIRMLSTTLLPTSGRAWVVGHDVTREERQVRRLVGVVSSNERSFYWRLNGRENLRFFSGLYQLPEREVRPWREELIDILGLAEIVDRRFDQYSTGEKQRMAIARGLLTRPKILLMDEPTKGVDPVGAAELVRLIQQRIVGLWHPTILVTSHNLVEIERLCDRVALMHRGRMLALGAIDELRAKVRRTDTYRLSVSGLDEITVETLVTDCGGDARVQTEPAENGLDVEVSFAVGSRGFPSLVRAIVNAGGDLVSCTSSQVSLEEIFHALLEESAARHVRVISDEP